MANNLIVRGGADFSRFNQALKNAENRLSKFQSAVASKMKKVESILATIGASLALGTAIKDAAKFEANMKTLSESLGSSIEGFEEWQKTVGRSLGFSKQQSAELANTLSLNFKQFATSQQDLLEKTTKMMEVAAVVANKRGMSMSEVSDRIRSAMNQEADGADELGVNVRVAAITASRAYQEMANGQPWEQLSTNMQKAILYHHILEQVSTNLGMTIQDSTAMRISVFTATLQDLKLALGQAFTPIVYTVLPALTALINKIAQALSVVGQFMSVLFGIKGGSGNSKAPGGFNASPSTINDQAKAVSNLGDAVKSAGKKAKKAAKETKKATKDMLGLASIDELNTLNIPKDAESGVGASDGGGAGGVGGGGIEAMDFSAFESDGKGVFNRVSEKVKEFAEKVRKFLQPAIDLMKKAWGAVSEYAGEKIKELADFFKKYGPQIIQALQNVWNFLKPIVMFLVKWFWESMKGLIDGIIQVFEGIIKFLTGVFTGDWKLAWEGLKDIFFGVIKAIWNFFNLSLIGSLRKGVVKLAKDLAKNFKNIWKNIKEAFSGAQKWFSDVGVSIWNGLTSPFRTTGSWFKTNVWTKITSAFSNAVSWFKNLGSDMWTGITKSFSSVKSWFTSNVWNNITSVFSSAASWFKTLGSNLWSNLIGAFSSVKSWFTTNVWNQITSVFSSAANWFKTLSSNMWSNLRGGFTSVKSWFTTNVWNQITSAFSSATSWFKTLGSNMWKGIKDGFTSVKTWFTNNVVNPIKNAFNGIKTTFQSIVSDNLKKAINTAISKINDAIGSINKVKNKIPGVKNLPNIPKIPMLAQGGYIGANSPLLAVIGDNKHEGEIVAPESKIYEQTLKAVKDALGSYSGNGTLELTINFGSSRIYRKIIDGINQEQRRAGKILLDI